MSWARRVDPGGKFARPARMVAIEGENMRGVTWMVVEEVKSGDSGIGGHALTTEDVRALAAVAPS